MKARRETSCIQKDSKSLSTLEKKTFSFLTQCTFKNTFQSSPEHNVFLVSVLRYIRVYTAFKWVQPSFILYET